MDKITKSILNSFVDQFDLGKYPEDKQFENFVNYCITTKLYRNSFELDDVHTGSGGDAGIDGLFFIVNGKLIIDEDELKDIVFRLIEKKVEQKEGNSAYLDEIYQKTKKDDI